ncbi:MAG: DnaD domain protein [Oscillospiraceae bacterium]|jgi:DnaD/phage-associated family protein|nr:DnaD domain protein [Oscillospiraceae bacterium]
MYQVNPASFGSVFVMPAEVVDKHLRLAGSVQLKVLLWFYRHAAACAEIDELVNFIGLPKADVFDALQYWVDCGLLIKQGEALLPQAVTPPPGTKEEAPEPAEEKKRESLPEIPLIKPTMRQVAARMGECAEVRSLFLEAQNILGRTIGFDAQSALLMLHDHYGLPAPVILMLCEYARSHNKQNAMNYILKLGKDWAEREIDTFEKATEQLSRLETANAAWNRLKVLAGIATPLPTTKQQSYLSVWVGDWGFSVDMIYAAYEEMAEKTGGLSFNYINKILQNWHTLGLKTPAEVEAFREERAAATAKPEPKKAAAKGAKKAAAKPQETSYDLDEAERKANYEPLIYKKKSGNN